MIVKFWWEDGEFLAEIEGKGLTKEKIEKLLDEYRKEDEYYDNWGWLEFLQKKGYRVKMVEPDCEIYF